MRGLPLPGERQRYRALALLEIRPRQGPSHFGGDRFDGNVATENQITGQHRKVLQRQLGGVGDQNGVAADLHRKLRSSDHGGANALAGIPDRGKIAPVCKRMAQFLGEVGAEIAEAPGFPLVEILGNSARKGHGVDALVGEIGGPGLRHQQAVRKLTRLTQIDQAHDHAGHAIGDALAV